MRRAAVALGGCLLVAVAIPTGWALTRPSSSAGPAVSTVLAPTTAATAGPQPLAAGPSAAAGGPPGVGPVTAAPATLPAVSAVAVPLRLRIDAIGVDAPIDPEGVDANGSMALPRLVDRVGWYSYGPAPGDPAGEAVIAGHVDYVGQGAGAMFRLRDTGVGMSVQVAMSDHHVLTYRIVAKETIVKERLPVARLFARTGPPRLILITCGGPFIASLGSYEDNVVVVAEPRT